MSEGGCTSKEPYALQVLGTSMEPEFTDGTVIIVDPGYPPCDGAFVVIDFQNETMLRQVVMHEGRKFLRPANEAYPTVELTEPYVVRGVVIQQSRRRPNRQVIHYDYHDANGAPCGPVRHVRGERLTSPTNG
jgi:SOS-response transcriptional repressor LexA